MNYRPPALRSDHKCGIVKPNQKTCEEILPFNQVRCVSHSVLVCRSGSYLYVPPFEVKKGERVL